MERHIRAHSRRAAISTIGSLRKRACSALTWSCTARSSSGLTSLATVTLMPEIDSAPSPTATWAARLGSSRHADVSTGRDVTVTVPRSLARWSRTRPVTLPTSRPTLLSIRLLSRPVALPAWPAIARLRAACRRGRSRSSSRRRGRSRQKARAPSSSRCRPWRADRSPGCRRLPDRCAAPPAPGCRGSPCNATATGATTVEVRATVGNGGVFASTGRAIRDGAGPERVHRHNETTNEAATTSAPPAILPTSCLVPARGLPPRPPTAGAC